MAHDSRADVGPEQSNPTSFECPGWFWVLVALAGIFLALDGDLFWDEPGYLYLAAYTSSSELLEGAFQPSGIESFYFPKILHLYWVKLVVALFGPGLTVLWIVMVSYAAMVGAGMLLAYGALRRLFPSLRTVGAATALVSISPIVLYLTFKTLPEAPAFFFATLSLYALVRNLEPQPSVFWPAIAGIALTGLALTRHNVALLLVGFTVAGVVIPPSGIPRTRILWRAGLTGLAGLAGTFILLTILGIGVERYLLATSLFEKEQPLILQVVSTALQYGVLWLLVPISFLVWKQRDFGFLFLWFLLATVPILWMFSHVEARYLIPNIIPFVGLSALALDHLARARVVRRLLRARSWVFLGGPVLVAVLVSNWMALRLMPAEVNIWHMARVVHQVQEKGRPANQVWLTAYAYTDFHYLTFTYPELRVMNATDPSVKNGARKIDRESERIHYRGRVVRTIEELSGLKGELILVGFGETFMVANARRILELIPGINSERLLPRARFLNHRKTSWIWDHPEIDLTLLTTSGPYEAYRIREIAGDADGRLRPEGIF